MRHSEGDFGLWKGFDEPMKLPKKITPDSIKDSIIEVRYSSQIPFEALVGIFFVATKEILKYSNRPFGKQEFPMVGTQPPITLSLGGINLFHNENIKVQLLPNSIVFNCLETYLGWDSYRQEIQKILSIFDKAIGVETYTRLGIRFITEYTEVDLVDCVKFRFTFGMPNITSDTYSFRSEFKLGKLKVILHLNNRLLVIRDRDKPPVPTSTIDLDVIEDGFEESNLDAALAKLDELHLKEKECFFSILQESFLESLNPEY